jgi:hypothetical protein
MKCWNSAFNTHRSREITVAVQVGAVKIYVAPMEALRKKRKTWWNSEVSPCLSFYCTFLARFFWNLTLFLTKLRGYWCCLFLTLGRTLIYIIYLTSSAELDRLLGYLYNSSMHLFDLGAQETQLMKQTARDHGRKQGITNRVALPIDKMLYIYLLCPHSEHQKIHSNLNTFTRKTGSPNVKSVLMRQNFQKLDPMWK